MMDAITDRPLTESQLLFARQLRAARRRRGLTLTELAAAVQIDKGYLSRIERALKVPAVGTVLNLARALGMSVAQLLGEALDGEAIHVSRAAARQVSAERDGSGYRFEVLTDGDAGTGLEGFLMIPPPEFTDDFQAEHDGEELLFVLGGEVEVKLPDRTVVLGRGDALCFPGHLPHQLRRLSPDASVLIAIARA